MEELIQKNLDQNRGMIERIPLEDKRDWKGEFVKWFYKEPAMELANGVGTPENIADWWIDKLAEQKKELMEKSWEYVVKASREEHGSKEDFIKFIENHDSSIKCRQTIIKENNSMSVTYPCKTGMEEINVSLLTEDYAPVRLLQCPKCKNIEIH